MLVAGVDGYKKGWVAVVTVDGAFQSARVFGSIQEVEAGLPDAVAIGVDMPIGLPSGPTRQADRLARKFVGPRALSVFSTPPRAVIEAPDYETARRISLERFDRGVSSQSYRGLGPKLREVDAAVRLGSRIFEVHPEVSFRGLAGSPMHFYKKSWNGMIERRRLLANAGIVIPDTLDEAGAVPVDDVLDAAVGAWTAARFARGEAVPLPDPPEVDEFGRQVAIWW